MTDSDFITLLNQHDWHFERSDDNREYSRGFASQKKLLYLCQQQPELFRLYNHAANCIIRNIPFDFQSVLGSLPRMDEKQHTQTTTPMKDLLWPIFEPLVKQIVDAIDRNTAAKGGAPYDAPDSPAPSTPPPPAEKPAPAKPAKAKAEKPAPAPEPVADLPAISEARLKATVMTLPNEGKAKLKKYFVEKFGYNTMAEIAEEHRGDIHAAAVKIGATDTDPDAEVEM